MAVASERFVKFPPYVSGTSAIWYLIIFGRFELRHVLVDSDCGVDDALALAYLVRSTDVELAGVTTTWGNCTAEEAAANARHVLDAVGATHVRVASGSQPYSSWRRGDAHGPDGLGGTESPRPRWTGPTNAVETIIQFARDHAGAGELLCIGPLTNLSAALSQEPRLPVLLKRVVVMGGHGASTSEWLRQVGDTNTRHDPVASQHIASSELPILWIGIDVTRAVLLTNEDFGVGEPGRILRRIHQDYGVSRGAAYGYDPSDNWRVPAHDGVTASCFVDPVAAGLVAESGQLSVVDESDTGPALKVVGPGLHQIATGIDAAAVRTMLRRGTQ
ncbi:nucleoside hydrolase [Rhodococcus sp. NPDC019627]|uniref:nucleoside hydrolase n=1 Tax=unclassified Rhodococcus (in: high G+C Gram-positive bacteria) TaxID=192944 RepID=UPI0033D68451